MCFQDSDTAEVKPKKKKKKKREDKEVQDVNQEDNEVHEITKEDNEVHEIRNDDNEVHEMTKEDNDTVGDKPDEENQMDKDEHSGNENEHPTRDISGNEVGCG